MRGTRRLEAQWANLRAGPRTLSEVEAHALVAYLYPLFIDEYRDNPSEHRFWRVELIDRVLQSERERVELFRSLGCVFPDWWDSMAAMENWCRNLAAKIWPRRGWSWTSRACGASSGRLPRSPSARRSISNGVLRGTSMPRRDRTGLRAVREPGQCTRPRRRAFRFRGGAQALDRREAAGTQDGLRMDPRPAPAGGPSRACRCATRERGRPHRLEGRARRGWSEAEGRSGMPRSRRYGRSSSAPSTTGSSTATRRARRRRREYPGCRGSARLHGCGGRHDPARRAASNGSGAALGGRFICAYSGARVSEVCQLRREDIHQHEGVWCMRIAAEAGSLKNVNSERAVPLHPALISEGFLGFLDPIKSGPIFAGLPPDIFGNGAATARRFSGVSCAASGLTDPRLGPNHSWRQRFKSKGLVHGSRPRHRQRDDGGMERAASLTHTAISDGGALSRAHQDSGREP